MPGNTITSANAVVQLTVDGLFPTPVQIQQFSADRMFETQAVEVAMLQLGADGILSAGWIPRVTPQTFEMMADSPSGFIFEQWDAAQVAAQQLYPANGTITLPGIGRKYAMTNGFLMSVVTIPSAGRVLAARAFTIHWNAVTGAPI
jgi:hypothetical protein